MKIELINKILIFLIIGILISCDHGIDPEKPEEIKAKSTGISGTIFYKNWPPLPPEPDSLYNLKLVIYKEYPPQDLMGEVIEYFPEYFEENLTYRVDSTTYAVSIDTGYYEYIVVAQQYGQYVYFDWWVVGHYDTTLQDSIPTGVTVYQDSIINNINIFVDFDSVLFKPPEP